MSVQINKLPDALYSWFGGDQAEGTIYAAVGGRLYKAGSAPHGVTWPYLTYSLMLNDPEYYGTKSAEHVRVSFGAWEKDDPDCAKVDLLIAKLRQRFDWRNITFSGNEYRTVWFRPAGSTGGLPASPSTDERRSMHHCDYRWWVEEI